MNYVRETDCGRDQTKKSMSALSSWWQVLLEYNLPSDHHEGRLRLQNALIERARWDAVSIDPLPSTRLNLEIVSRYCHPITFLFALEHSKRRAAASGSARASQKRNKEVKSETTALNFSRTVFPLRSVDARFWHNSMRCGSTNTTYV